MNKNPKDTIVARIIAGGFGILWTILAISITAESPWPVAKIIFPGFGILFTIVAFLGGSSEKGRSGDENTAPKPDISLQRQERPTAPREKKAVYCPYCGTAQEEDYKTCDSCGAARKNK